MRNQENINRVTTEEDDFCRYSVIRLTKEGKTLSVKKYTNLNDYVKDLPIMTSAFEQEEDAIRECKRIAKLYKLKVKLKKVL